MDGEALAAVQFPAVLKKRFEPLLKAFADRHNAEMVPARAAALLRAEGADQKLRHGLQKPVALGEAVPAVIEFHAGQIQIEEHRHLALAQEGLPGKARELEEMRQAGQARQMVILDGLEDAALVQGVAQ